jgi:hypothetical protein
LRRLRRREFTKVNREPTVSLYQERLEQSRCTRCGVEVPDGNDLCDEHAEDKRARQKRWQAEERARRRALGLCLWCLKSGGIAPAVDGGSSCLRCRINRRRVPPPGVNKQSGAAPPPKQVARSRYRGKGKRGRQSRAEQNAQDFRKIHEMIAAAEFGFRMLESDEAKSWGWAEQNRIAVASRGQFDLVTRFFAEVSARYPRVEEQRGGVLNGPVSVRSSSKT